MHRKKRVKTFLLFFVVAAVAMFIECDVSFPDEIQLFNGEQIPLREGTPYTVEAAASAETTGDYTAQVKLFGMFPVKEVNVDVLPELNIVPGGKTVGIKMFTKGVMCVGTEPITGKNGNTLDAAKEIGLHSADMILSADGVPLTTVEQFANIVASSKGKTISLCIQRNGDSFEKNITPIETTDGFKLGIWVRDSTAGIGTVTFVEQKSNVFGALGHPITDVDTGTLMPIDQGSVSGATIVTVTKGKRGTPGELGGLFEEQGHEHGIIFRNTSRGIFGVMEENYSVGLSDHTVKVASKSQVHTGKAQIYANVEDDKVEAFDVKITKIMKHAKDDKNMVIEITDRRLLDITGGIVQGMSGAPILQDGKLIGAITHVFVNDPTKGYGIFIESMLEEAGKIK